MLVCRRRHISVGSAPLSSEKPLSFLSNRNAQRSTSGIGTLGNFDSKGMLKDEADGPELWRIEVEVKKRTTKVAAHSGS